MRLSEILNNRHFCNLVSIIRIPLRSYDWQGENPEVRFSSRIFHLESLMTKKRFEDQSGRNEFTQLFLRLLKDIKLADDRLRYTNEDIQWFVQIMEQEHALVTMSMLLASAHAEDQYMSPPEIAAQTGTSESNWRNKAAAGDFPGAYKQGRVWLIPYSVLRSRGIIEEHPTHNPVDVDELSTETE